MQVASNAPARMALRYYGSKWRLAPWIISHFPQHYRYITSYGGAASVLLQKPRSRVETYNDLDGNVVNFFRVLREQPDELIRQIRLTPWAREEYEASLHPTGDAVERARLFWCLTSMGINSGTSGKNPGMRFSTKSTTKIFELSSPDKVSQNLYAVAQRFSRVQIEHRDALKIIERYDAEDALHYVDPPYLTETRTHTDIYNMEIDTTHHKRLADALHTVSGYVIISGYPSELYAQLYEAKGWLRKDQQSRVNSGGVRTESIWISPRTFEAIECPKQTRLF